MVLDFLRKFFCFFDYGGNSLEQYSDHLGKGALDIRHFIWIAIAIGLFIAIKMIKDKKTNDKIYKILKVLLAIMFLTRLGRQIYAACVMAENPYWRAIFPIHLCSTMIYLLPIVVLFNIKPLKHPVYFLSILGGTITILVGDYFDSLFMTFGTLEGTYAHTLILVSSIFLLNYEQERFTADDFIKCCMAMCLLGLWSTIFNVILGQYYSGSNYLYLVRNMLPFGDSCFRFIYLIIYTGLAFGFYILLNIKDKKQIKKDLEAKKVHIFAILTIMIILAFVITVITDKYATVG